MLVASEDALDQFFMREPEALLDRSVEATRLDHANPRILDPHVYAAAYEGPLTDADADTLGPEALVRAAVLPELERDAGRIRLEGARHTGSASLASLGRPRLVHDRRRHQRDPSSGSSSASARTRPFTRAPSTSISASSTSFGSSTASPARRSSSPPASTGTHRCKKDTQTAIEQTLRSARVAGVELQFGRVSVTEQVIAYQRKAIRDGSTLDVVPADPARGDLRDRGGLVLPRASACSRGSSEMPRLLGALHAAEHALISLLPLWAMCDRWDIGGLSTNLHFQTGLPTVFVYDGHAGGVGITERGFECFAGWVSDTARLLRGCPCTSGCPSCVQSPKCGNLNEMLDKELLRPDTLVQRMSQAPELGAPNEPFFTILVDKVEYQR